MNLPFGRATVVSTTDFPLPRKELESRCRPRLRRWIQGAVATFALAIALPGHAEKLSVDEAVERAAKESPMLLAAIHDVQAARHAVVAAREIVTRKRSVQRRTPSAGPRGP